jgi:SAM-dependent methyltransferase
MLEKSTYEPALSLVHAGIVQCLSASEAADGLVNLRCDIHPNDQMFTHSLSAHGDSGAALSQYFNIGLQQFRCFEGVLRWISPDATRCRVLDFACGFGRSLRFATALHRRPMIWASDIQADAVAFVKEHLAATTILSVADPAKFECTQRFDMIWVASLFTHLPKPLFSDWLRKLASLLAPDGLLCFSARDKALLSGDKRLDESGFHYQEDSENAGLSSDIYGTSYVDERFVAECCRRVIGERACYARIPRMLAMEQDLYCVSATPRDLSALTCMQRGCWGWVDIRNLHADGRLHLEGWAASIPDGPADYLSILVGDQQFDVLPQIARPDVVDVFAEPRLLHSGWRFEQDIGPIDCDIPIVVTARSRKRSPTALLYAGMLRAK